MMGSLPGRRPDPMRTPGSRNTIRFSLRILRVCSLTFATLGAATLCAQRTGLGFWEPPPSVDALLEHTPHHDADRYAALRQAFIEYHCADPQQDESEAARKGRNLLCTLPGQTSDTILVVARYDGRAGAGFQPTWVDAYLLPLLDHALQAQTRRHTFVFAALDGDDGETAFFNDLHKSGQPQPSAMIILDGLGWGRPLWYTVPSVKATPGHAAELGANGVLGGIASAIDRFLKLPDPAGLTPAGFKTEA
jgi:hypothetical protein